MAHDRGITDILGDLGDQIGHLFRTELRIAEAEAEDKVKKVATSLAPIVAGVVVAMAAILLLLLAVAAFLIEQGMSASMALLLVAVAAVILGYILIRAGSARLGSIDVTPKRAVGQLREDFALAKDQVTAS